MRKSVAEILPTSAPASSTTPSPVTPWSRMSVNASFTRDDPLTVSTPLSARSMLSTRVSASLNSDRWRRAAASTQLCDSTPTAASAPVLPSSTRTTRCRWLAFIVSTAAFRLVVGGMGKNGLRPAEPAVISPQVLLRNASCARILSLPDTRSDSGRTARACSMMSTMSMQPTNAFLVGQNTGTEWMSLSVSRLKATSKRSSADTKCSLADGTSEPMGVFSRYCSALVTPSGTAPMLVYSRPPSTVVLNFHASSSLTT
mmetsp:Transcript_38559/g.97076  ORF Transcript_38559/g.97076 Transcript_38559/m.97076 type:complete len:257 (-) Transcript_38559:481-1251(-)